MSVISKKIIIQGIKIDDIEQEKGNTDEKCFEISDFIEEDVSLVPVNMIF